MEARHSLHTAIFLGVWLVLTLVCALVALAIWELPA